MASNSRIVRLTFVTLPKPVSMSQRAGREVAFTMWRALSSISLKLRRPTSVKPATAVEEPDPLT